MPHLESQEWGRGKVRNSTSLSKSQIQSPVTYPLNKATHPSPIHTIPPTGNHIFKCSRLFGETSHSNHHNGDVYRLGYMYIHAHT